MTNEPYVKKYKDGTLVNPIIGKRETKFDNREVRRFKEARFKGNKKGASLTVLKTLKLKRETQKIYLKDKDGNPTGEIKRISHYR